MVFDRDFVLLLVDIGYYLPHFAVKILKLEGLYDRFIVQGLLCNEEFLVRVMQSKEPFENLVPKIKNWSQIDWFQNQFATWNKKFQPEFTEVWTKSGIGFAFNMLDPSKFFRSG